MTTHPRLVLAVLSAALAAGCGSSHHDAGCNTADPGACGSGQVCEPVSGSVPACFTPLVVKGTVTNLATGTAIAGARVVAMDANRAPAGAVATTDGSGAYAVSVPATRNADGSPAAASVTLRADAQGFQPFPGGVRTALPIDLSGATFVSASSQWVVQGTLTAVKLIALPSTTDLMSISGTVAQPPSRVGVLVVATPTATPTTGGQTAIAGLDGTYTIFNVSGSAGGTPYAVNAYGQGANYETGSATLTTGSAAPVVNLALKSTPTASISGNLIFNSGATAPTSVALAVLSTYDADLDRGESPPGLVAQVASGASTYAFAGVPDGTYVALAAFGIDGDVRDVSGVGNTAPVVLTVQSGALVGSPASFKLVGAVALSTIDGQAVTNSGVPLQISSAAPVFQWAKAASYSAASSYEVDVYDAFGTRVWGPFPVSGSGSGPYSATYAGTALQSGMYYQLRVTALDVSSSRLSYTEDLKGVFFKP